MNPSVSNIYEENGSLKLTISGVDISIASAIRRTILSTIPCVVFRTESFETNKCKIQINTSRLHDQMIEHRMGCIPIHIPKDLGEKELVENYVAELDLQNNTDSVIYATTEHLRIRNKHTNVYLPEEDVRRVFPPDEYSRKYIIITRLRPKISDTILGEHIKLSCEFGMGSADINAMYNVVSECTCVYTPDMELAKKAWEKKAAETQYASEEEKEYHRRNFWLLDAKRYYVPNSYDLTIETVGVYENRTLLKKAIAIMHNKCLDMSELIDSNVLTILNSETGLPTCCDVVLENEDETLGTVLQGALYNKYYKGEQILNYCGFKKFHYSDADSILRIGFKSLEDESSKKLKVREILKTICMELGELFVKINSMV